MLLPGNSRQNITTNDIPTNDIGTGNTSVRFTINQGWQGSQQPGRSALSFDFPGTSHSSCHKVVSVNTALPCHPASNSCACARSLQQGLTAGTPWQLLQYHSPIVVWRSNKSALQRLLTCDRHLSQPHLRPSSDGDGTPLTCPPDRAWWADTPRRQHAEARLVPGWVLRGRCR